MLYKYSNHLKFYLMLVFGLIASFQNIIAAYMIQTLTNIATNKNWDKISQFLILVISALMATFIASLIFNRLKTDNIKQVNIYLRSHIFQGMINEDAKLGFLTNDFKLLETNRFDAQIEIVMEAISLVFALTYALAVNWVITILFLLGSCVPMLVSNMFQKPVQRVSQAWTQANAEYVDQSKNFLAGNKTIKLYNGQRQATLKNKQKILPLEERLRKMNLLNLDTNSWVNFIAGFVTFLLPFIVGIFMVVYGMTTLGALFAIVQLSNSFVNPILTILEDRNKLSTTKKIVNKSKKYLNYVHDNSTQVSDNLDQLQLEKINLIRKGQKLIENLSFKIKIGQKIAIIGPSGSGKSTLLQYLMYGKHGNSQNIFLNDRKVSDGTFTNLFAYASQTPVIFSDDLQFNLTLGKNISQEILEKTCQELGLSEVIKDKGLGYQLGDNADQLSGGQLARIELARAILSKRKILLLDEINASLDKQTSNLVHQYLLDSKLTFIEVIHHYEAKDLKNYDQVINLNDYLVK